MFATYIVGKGKKTQKQSVFIQGIPLKEKKKKT